MLDGSTEAANYRIAPYETSFDSYDKAIEALRNERRLEMTHEGHRFFDLVRWGMAADVLNDYLKIEKTRRTHLTGASFVAGKHEYMPIPQSQIDLGREMIEQTEGY